MGGTGNENYLASLITSVVDDAAAPICDFDWKLCQSAWASVVEKSFKNGSSLYSELIPLEHAPIIGKKISPLVDACCSCAGMLEDQMGTDEIAPELMGQCLKTHNRTKVFIYLALAYYNAMVAARNQPFAWPLMQKSYLANATYYNKNGRLPDSGPPTEEQMQRFARQAIQPKQGCLIPLIALTMGMVAVFVILVRLS